MEFYILEEKQVSDSVFVERRTFDKEQIGRNNKDLSNMGNTRMIRTKGTWKVRQLLPDAAIHVSRQCLFVCRMVSNAWQMRKQVSYIFFSIFQYFGWQEETF